MAGGARAKKLVALLSNLSSLSQVCNNLSDFDGQHRAEKLSRFIITLFGIVGLIWGAIIQQFSQTVYILGAGFLLAALVTVPPWPIYRQKSLNWQKARPDSSSSSTDESKKKKK